MTIILDQYDSHLSTREQYMQTKHTTFYIAYHALRDHLPELALSGSYVDELDSLIWSALGHSEFYTLSNTYDLTEFDCSRLRLLSGPNGLSLFKMMLARRDHDNRCYWET